MPKETKNVYLVFPLQTQQQRTSKWTPKSSNKSKKVNQECCSPFFAACSISSPLRTGPFARSSSINIPSAHQYSSSIRGELRGKNSLQKTSTKAARIHSRRCQDGKEVCKGRPQKNRDSVCSLFGLPYPCLIASTFCAFSCGSALVVSLLFHVSPLVHGCAVGKLSDLKSLFYSSLTQSFGQAAASADAHQHGQLGERG